MFARVVLFTAAVALMSVNAAPAFANDVCQLSSSQKISPAQASSALQAALPSGATLGTSSSEQLIEAFKAASKDNAGYAAELASLIAVARPDTLASLKSAVTEVCPTTAKSIIEAVEESAANPTPDQLAALATSEGVAPAAGPDAGNDVDGSQQ